jgi:GntR family transcriptional regulator, transcriptional repressor for pyruvate dehydrogenase complex
MVDPTSSGNLTDRLTDSIRAKLQSGQFREGDVFMTEAQLAAENNVSRTIIREAVSRLRGLGILESRQRKGLVVRRPDPLRLLSESLPSLAGSEEDFRELTKLRYVLEVGSIELAVTNANDDQIKELGQFAEAFAQSVRCSKDVTQTIELDLQFHMLLLKMTDSSFVAGLHEVLARFFEANVVRLESVGESGERTIRQHHELVSAIRDRDTERARYLIRSHIHCYLENETTDAPDS